MRERYKNNLIKSRKGDLHFLRVALFIVFVREACFHSVASRDYRRLLVFGPSFQDFGGMGEPSVASRDWRRLLGLGPSFQDFGGIMDPNQKTIKSIAPNLQHFY